MKNLPHPRAGEGRGGGAGRERILMATGAALVGLFVVLYIVLPLLSELGQSSNLLWVAYALVALGIPFGLLLPTVIRPRSVVAAVVAALAVGLLLIVGMSITPQSLPRVVIHLAAILCLAALVLRVIRGVAARRFRELWIVPILIVGVAIPLGAGGAIGLHNVLQFCHWPPLSDEISSILCSG